MIPDPALAYISQVDGTVVPVSARMQACLDRAGTGESPAGAVDALVDAMISPEAYRPVEDPVGSGQYPVTFEMLGEGGGYQNIIGYYFTDNPGDLRLIFDCRTGGSCGCPCDPDSMRSDDGSATSWRRTIDFASEAGFTPGRAIGFFIRTNEELGGGSNTQHCGVGLTDALSADHRTYYTSKALNDDGDYVHFLVYESQTYTNAYYFGFEDLYRGGDNDFEDSLLRATGLVPTCVPQLETCDGTDEDCDLNIDEGVTQACSTACGAGVQMCAAGAFGSCSAPVRGTETCDGTDEDCDGNIDEGLTQACSNECGTGTEVCVAGSWAGCDARTPTLETCDGTDEDCDGNTDESISRACSTMCGGGTETCSMGSYMGCTAPAPGSETCNGLDDDCDGRTDEGITQACSTICGSGTERCVAGAFVGCTAAVPTLETCNGLDEDCDGAIDEELTRSCTSICGAGTETCAAGAWTGCDAPSPTDEVCNGLDDDCDGVVDDGDPGGGAMCLPDGEGGYNVVEAGTDACIPGRVRCVAGELSCAGATSPSPEVCNCQDDDCDGEIDEESDDSSLCPGLGACVDCSCLTPCAGTEFPCPSGRTCDTSLANADLGVIGYCVAGACADVECDDTEVCDPDTGACVDRCADVECTADETCVRGICVEDSCYGLGCDAGERCFEGACEADPCLGVTCAAEEYCLEGECTAVCDHRCDAGQHCEDNVCVDDDCALSCPSGASCVAGSCVEDDCPEGCGSGRTCVGTSCVDDLCAHVECPSDTSCEAGQCFTADAQTVSEPRYGYSSGGGGLACAAGPLGGEGRGTLLLLVLGLLGLRRRSRRARSHPNGIDSKLVSATLLVLPLLSTLGSGCTVTPICIGDCPGSDAGDAGDAGVDATAADGCVSTGAEFCNGIDDDCDGLTDEGYDLESDPSSCGGCDNECAIPHAFPACSAGACVVDTCEIGYHDLDGNGTNGCEYECLESGDEICDLRDNDCDGATDEGFALDTDVSNCGACGTVCAYANASAVCDTGVCSQGDCRDGFVDANGGDGDGCEVACPDGAAAESCNGLDDDCDARIDEGFSLDTDVANCGACGRACSFAFAGAVCADGVCGLGTCSAGHYDVDGLPSTGCEYACTPSGAETCNGSDDDCDGVVDESDPTAGTACGSTTGDCSAGVWTCQGGALNCVGAIGATPEVCGGGDEDCDGNTDENPGGSTIAGTGVRCGTTNAGECVYGSVVCSGGSLVCGGALVGPSAETCNGLDDDCNGATDDGLSTPAAASVASCAETRGVCAGRTPTCRGTGGWGCDLPSTYQADESLCDGLDNDCDGSVDEGCPTFRGSDIRLDSGSLNSVQPVISSDGVSNVYASWMEVDGRAHILFRRSTDGGASFGTAYRVDTAGGASIGPRLMRPSGALVSLFADFRGGTSYREIYTARSTNAGASFATDFRINPGQNTDSFNIEAAVAGNTVHIVYETFTTSRKRRIYHAASFDGGATWSSPTRVSSFDDSAAAYDGFVETDAVVAATGSTVHVAWRDNRAGGLDIYYARSTDGGSTWTTARRLDLGTVAGSSSSFDPAIAAEGNNVYVVWVDDRSGSSFDIYMNRSTTDGASWLGAAVNIDDDTLPHDGSEPAVVTTAAGELVVAWVDLRSGFADIIARHSASAGASFTNAFRLDTGTAAGTSESVDLTLAADGDFVVAAWADDRAGAYDIHTNYSIDAGANWQDDDVRLDADAAGTADSTRPFASVVGDRADVVWVDARGGANAQIFSSSYELP